MFQKVKCNNCKCFTGIVTERNFKAGDIVKHFKREFLKGE